MNTQELKDRKTHLLAVLKERQLENGIVQEEFQKGYYAGFTDGCDAIIVKLEEPKDTAKLLSETVQKMCDTLQHILDNEPEIDEGSNVYGWICYDLDYVQVNFFQTNPDGNRQLIVKTEKPMTADEAIQLLSVRINNTMQTLL